MSNKIYIETEFISDDDEQKVNKHDLIHQRNKRYFTCFHQHLKYKFTHAISRISARK